MQHIMVPRAAPLQVLQLCLPLLCRLTAARPSYAALCDFCAKRAIKVISSRISRVGPTTFADELVTTLSACCNAAAAPAPAYGAAQTLPLFARTFPRDSADVPWTPPSGSSTASAPSSMIATLVLTPPVATALTGWLLPLLAYTFATQAVALAPHTAAIVGALATALYAAPLSSLAPGLQILTTLSQRADTADLVHAHMAAPDILSAACALLTPRGGAGSDVAAAAADLCTTLGSALMRSGLVAPADVRAIALPGVLTVLAQPAASLCDAAAAGTRVSDLDDSGRTSLLALARALLVAVDVPGELLRTLWAVPECVLSALVDTSGQRAAFGSARDASAVSVTSASIEQQITASDAAPAKRQRTSNSSDAENAGAANGGRVKPAQPSSSTPLTKPVDQSVALHARPSGDRDHTHVAWGCPLAAQAGAPYQKRVQRLATASLVLQCAATLVSSAYVCAVLANSTRADNSPGMPLLLHCCGKAAPARLRYYATSYAC